MSGELMRIEFRCSGGIAFFPGLNKTSVLDVDALSQDEAARLRQLIDEAHFYALPTTVGRAKPGAADYKQYAITAQQDERRHCVNIIEPIEDPALRALVVWLKAWFKFPG